MRPWSARRLNTERSEQLYLPGPGVHNELAVILVCVVCYRCPTVMIYPQLADDDIVDERFRFAPREVVTGLREPDVRST